MRNRLIDNLLADYAAGSLDAPMRALVASHLELKSDNRAFVAALMGVGGIFLDDAPPVALTGRDRRLVNIFASEDDDESSPVRPIEAGPLLPAALRRYLAGPGIARANRAVSAAMLVTRARADRLEASRIARGKPVVKLPDPMRELASFAWKSVMPGLRQAVVAQGEFGEASFLHSRAGARMLSHSHDGLEVTLVLRGVLEDQVGPCERGDISVADDGVNHRPRAGVGEDCVCFSVSQGRARLTGPVGRWLQRILG